MAVLEDKRQPGIVEAAAHDMPKFWSFPFENPTVGYTNIWPFVVAIKGCAFGSGEFIRQIYLRVIIRDVIVTYDALSYEKHKEQKLK
ncbi:hypothetical protein COLO4_27731 [Corchorus olitorius]|uniref:Uncharacterized protein n=1 Tax=Corchorus olitorius TaxID=93759 RepID=A0A1R3HPD9_9ROSI|nr:hypothetical protein COLO4_27731 [Corchorus olitorius]